MHQIDFLPAQYRERHAVREGTQRRVLVAALFAAMLVAAGMAQNYVRRQTERELAEVLPHYEAAQRLTNQLTELQGKLQAVRSMADLHTYLVHPWPRTQLLSRLIAALPANVALSEIRIARDNSQGRESAGRQSQAQKQAEEQQLTKMAPAARDLKWLRENYDRSPVVIQLSGTTSDSTALHCYLAALGKNDLFAKVNLVSIENSPAASKQRGTAANEPADHNEWLRFSARVVVLPGYGQPGGPTGTDSKAVGPACRAGQDTTTRAARVDGTRRVPRFPHTACAAYIGPVPGALP